MQASKAAIVKEQEAITKSQGLNIGAALENNSDDNSDTPSVGYKVTHRFLPPMVAELKWLRQIKGQVCENVTRFSQLKHP